MLHSAAIDQHAPADRAAPGGQSSGPWTALVCAGLIANFLRHRSQRSIDVTWLLQNSEYARHIIYLARQSEDPAMMRHALRLESALATQYSDARGT